ncbi:MAG: sugar kinase [Anaerolineae bacterium]
MLRFSVKADQLLIDAPTFDVAIAGAESNVAVAVAQMGFRSGWFSRLTNNTLGQRLTRTLTSYGVDCSNVVWTSEDRVGTYFLEFGSAPRPTRVVYDRQHSATSKMTPFTFDDTLVGKARILHLTGITAALSDGCYALLTHLIDTAQKEGVHVVFDVNYRALLWSAETCREKLTPLLAKVSTLLINQRDAENIFGIRGEPTAKIKALHERFGVEQIGLTIGEKGALGYYAGEIIEASGYTVQIVDRIGAGDAFAAGVICGLLENNFALGIRYGVAISALQLTLAGDIFRLGRSDVLQLMNSQNSTMLLR